jgi:hypothetical protein
MTLFGTSVAICYLGLTMRFRILSSFSKRTWSRGSGLFGGLCLIVTACRPSSESLSGCLGELRLPVISSQMRPPLSVASEETQAEFSISSSGEANLTRVSGGTALQQLEVKASIAESHFLPRCAGSSFTLRFRFQTKGEAREYPRVTYRLVGTSTYIIESEPELPILERFGGPNPK